MYWLKEPGICEICGSHDIIGMYRGVNAYVCKTKCYPSLKEESLAKRRRPTDICEDCGQLHPVFVNTKYNRKLCSACYQRRSTGGSPYCEHCGKGTPTNTLARSGTICQECYDRIKNGPCRMCNEVTGNVRTGKNIKGFGFCDKCYQRAHKSGDFSTTFICSHCHEEKSRMEKPSGAYGKHNLCKSCIESLKSKPCKGCGRTKIRLTIIGKWKGYCQNCITATLNREKKHKETFRCSICEQEMSVKYKKQGARSQYTNGHICVTCYETNSLVTCKRCKKTKKLFATGKYQGHCDACKSRIIEERSLGCICSRCKEYIQKDKEDISRSGRLCSNCREELKHGICEFCREYSDELTISWWWDKNISPCCPSCLKKRYVANACPIGNCKYCGSYGKLTHQSKYEELNGTCPKCTNRIRASMPSYKGKSHKSSVRLMMTDEMFKVQETMSMLLEYLEETEPQPKRRKRTCQQRKPKRLLRGNVRRSLPLSRQWKNCKMMFRLQETSTSSALRKSQRRLGNFLSRLHTNVIPRPCSSVSKRSGASKRFQICSSCPIRRSNICLGYRLKTRSSTLSRMRSSM